MKSKLLILFATLGIMACDEEEVQTKPPHLQETMQSMQVLFVEENSRDTLVFSYYDPDGVGGENPTITSSPLQANTDYELFLDFFADTDTLPFNLKEELVAESHLHQVFFESDTTLKINFNYADSDINNKPVGYKAYAYTQQSSSGILRVVLRHEPDKAAPGVADGDSEKAGGSTDIAADFQIVIQ